MRDFTFGGQSLASFGGRILQAPSHTVAKRNKTFLKIYGQSGDEIIDNESYDNVDFSLKIGFLPLLSQQTAGQLAHAAVDWLAPLQNGYYEYRDTFYGNGWFTMAALTNFEEIVAELPSLLTATLKFSRVPFWYSDAGQTQISFYPAASAQEIVNPESYPSEPYYIFQTSRSEETTARITINGAETAFPVSGSNNVHRFAGKQHFRINNGVKTYLGTELLPDLQPGANTLFLTTDSMMLGSFYLQITPNWRRL